MKYDITSLLPPPQTPLSSLSPSQAAALLLRRRQIRTDLTEWCIEALAPQGMRPARHHLLLLRYLSAVARGELDRLMVLMPPGSAKSTYASVLFPAWYLATHQQDSIIAASHTADLAERFGRKVRNLVDEHAETLGIHLSPDNASAGQWGLVEGGEYYAAGVLGPITGRRADIVTIDDPVKSRQDADSETIRDRVWEWWKADLSTRLKPGARVVLIQTRWHEDDLGGRLLADAASGGKPWKVLRLPMEAVENDPLGRSIGEPLWPEWFTADMRSEAKRDPRTWSALYQQAPAPDEGTYFSRDWLRPVSKMPPRETLRIYGASDYAVTDDGGDYTAHVIVGIDADSRMWLLDVWRGQTASDVWVETFCDLVLRWKPLGWAEETGQIKAGVGPFLTRRQRERHAYVARTPFPTRGDKSIRAQAIRGRMALDGLYLPANAPWRADFESEILMFPAGKHDDQCLAEGTLITMHDGTEKPIERVIVGDMVATPIGPRRVTHSAVTNESAELIEVSFSNGAVMRATHNHPVFIVGKGFVPVDALCYNDCVQLFRENECTAGHQRPMSSNIAVIAIDGIQRASTSTISAITTALSRAGDFCTGICGKTRSAPFQRGTTFTTRMRTRSTTSLGTLNACLFLIIDAAISPRLTSIISLGSVEPLLCGMGPKRVSDGTPSMASRPGLVVRRLLASASVAGQSLGHSLSAPASAPKRAVSVSGIRALTGRARVRNLTVERAHAYYASGILTHNCDALGLIGQLLDRMVVPAHAPDPDAPIRGALDMTLTEAWKHADPRSREGRGGRI